MISLARAVQHKIFRTRSLPNNGSSQSAWGREAPPEVCHQVLAKKLSLRSPHEVSDNEIIVRIGSIEGDKAAIFTVGDFVGILLQNSGQLWVIPTVVVESLSVANC